MHRVRWPAAARSNPRGSAPMSSACSVDFVSCPSTVPKCSIATRAATTATATNRLPDSGLFRQEITLHFHDSAYIRASHRDVVGRLLRPSYAGSAYPGTIHRPNGVLLTLVVAWKGPSVVHHKTISHARLRDEVARPQRVVLEFVAQLFHVDAQIVGMGFVRRSPHLRE